MNHRNSDLDEFFVGQDHPSEHSSTAPRVTTEDYRDRAAARADRRRKARKRRRTMIAVLVVIVVVGVGGFAVSNYAGSMLKARMPRQAKEPENRDYPGPGETAVEVSINPGDTGDDIATVLRDADVVATRSAYLDAASANPKSQGIQPGTYALMTKMSAQQALSVLLNAENRLDYVLTIPEGWRFDQVSTKVQSVLGVSQEDVDAALADTSAVGLPKSAKGYFEGWLAPGQYVFPRDVEVGQVFADMIARRVAELDKLEVKKSDREDLLKKASIVMQEAGPGDYAKVARVIENRLASNHRLEMDSTVAYGAGRDTLTLSLEEDFGDSSNPYNTYRHAGLPPSPINNPSLEAIEATLNPADGTWLYFVTVNLYTRETKFATTFAEHQKNVDEYRQWRSEHYEEGGSEGEDEVTQ